MDFTVFMNSRGRIPLLQNALYSIYNNTYNPSKMEIRIRYDDDDNETDLFFNKFKRDNLFPIKGPRPDNLAVTLNELANQSKGRYLFIFNNDAQLLTPNWDKICLENIDKFKKYKNIKDDVVFCSTSDTSVDKPPGHIYCSFSFISKEAVDALGYFVNEKLLTLGGDSHIQRIFGRLDRVVDCSEILVDHLLHNTIDKIINCDVIASEYREKNRKNPVNPFTLDIEEDVIKLQKYIDAKNG